MNKQEIFDLCDEGRYLFVEAFVEILKSKIDKNKFFINDISGYTVKMGICPDEEISNELMNNLEIDPTEIEGEGFYTVKGLFSICHDSDDYRSWIYLEQEIIEYVYEHSHEDEERWASFVPINSTELSDDLFPF